METQDAREEVLSIPSVNIVVRGCPHAGHLKINQKGFSFKYKESNKVEVFQKTEVEAGRWMHVARGFELQLQLKSGSTLSFDGFPKSQCESLRTFLKNHCDIVLREEVPAVKGWNWGEVAFAGTTMAFVVDERPAFEINLATVSSSAAQRNEAVIEFHKAEQATSDDSQIIESMRFVLLDNGTETGRAEKFVRQVMAKADVQRVTGSPIASFEDLQCLLPRGRYSVDFFPSFLRLHGKSNDYKIAYSSVAGLFLLPHQSQAFFVVGLKPPIRQGLTYYNFLVFLFSNKQVLDREGKVEEEEPSITVNLKLDTDDAKAKFPDIAAGSAESSLTMKPHECVSYLFRQLTGSKVILPRKDGFRSKQGLFSVKCSHKAFDGLLYPLPKAFLFLHKPTIHIRFDEISSISFQRDNFAGQAGSQSFDILIHEKDGQIVEFKSIPREDYSQLFHFIQDHKLNIANLGQKKEAESEASDFSASEEEEEEHDFYLNRVKQEGEENSAAAASEERERKREKKGGAEDDGEESDDEDFNPDAKGSGSDEGSGSDSEGSEDGSGSSDGSGSGSGSDSDSMADDLAGSSKTKKESKPKKKKEKAADDDEAKEKKGKKRAAGSDESDGLEIDSGSEKEKSKKKPAKKDKSDAASKPKAKKARDPNEPKKAQSSFFLWSAANREAVRAANPGISVTELGKLLGQKWKEVSDEEKETWKAKAQEGLEEYKQKKRDYDAAKAQHSGSDSEGDDDAGKKKRKKKDPNEPKRPMSAFFLWLQANRALIKEKHPDISPTELTKRGGELWREVSAEDRKSYEDKAAELKAKYEKDIAEYRKNKPADAAPAASPPPKPKPAAKKAEPKKRDPKQATLSFKTPERVEEDD